MRRRVAVTGAGAISALGDDWPTIRAALKAERNAVRFMPDWDEIEGLNTKLAAPAPHFALPDHYPRKFRRNMGRCSQMAVAASEKALAEAGLLDHPVLTSGRAGVAFGSSTGSTPAIADMVEAMQKKNTASVKATTYIQMMPHTTAFNVGVFFGLQGRLLPSSTACTSGSLSIGMAYECIRAGIQDVMVAGGAEELCISEAFVFDTLYATSQSNDHPERAPRPFDTRRDGLVIGEGAGAIVLEDYEQARARGATILAELVGFGANSDGRHATQPTAETMAVAMRLALADAGVSGAAIGYVSAHGTATDLGDIAETIATEQAVGRGTPISSMKSYIGHTLGACGAIEAMQVVHMMNEGWFAPTINLDAVDPKCGDLDYITAGGRLIETDHVMSNNFAFGGVNTSLVFRRRED